MENEVKKIQEQICGSKTILLPEDLGSDCYAVYSKAEYKNPNKIFLVDGKAYKHRLYFYKKLKNKSDKVLTFIFLNPGLANHIKQDAQIKKCEQIAGEKYGAIEIFSIFTLRTSSKLESVSEDAILDAMRADLSKNDIVLAYGDGFRRTQKYKNLSAEDLKNINKVRKIKINALLDFLSNQKRQGKIYTIGLTKSGNPKTVNSYKTGNILIEFE